MKFDEKVFSTLKFTGLSKNEIKVYAALITLGSCTAGEIARKAGIDRRNVYDALERLSKKGLVGFVQKGKVKYFEPSSPARILEIFKKKKEEMERKEKEITEILSKMLDVYFSTRENTSITVYKGFEGIKYVLNNVLEIAKENLVIGAHKVHKNLEAFLEQFHRKRISKKIVDKLLFNVGDLERAKKLSELPYTEVRLLPKGMECATCINIYAERVAILTFSEPTAILIKDKGVYTFFKEIFYMLWKISKKITRGSYHHKDI